MPTKRKPPTRTVTKPKKSAGVTKKKAASTAVKKGTASTSRKATSKAPAAKRATSAPTKSGPTRAAKARAEAAVTGKKGSAATKKKATSTAAKSKTVAVAPKKAAPKKKVTTAAAGTKTAAAAAKKAAPKKKTAIASASARKSKAPAPLAASKKKAAAPAKKARAPAKKASGRKSKPKMTRISPASAKNGAYDTLAEHAAGAAAALAVRAAAATPASPARATPVAGPSRVRRVEDGPIPEIDVVISFDTTGSMSSCINEVRKHIKELVNRLFTELTDLRVGIVAHGDYCDQHSSYLMKHIDLTDDQAALVDFMKVGNTGGGDYPEAYEYVLREVQKLSWRPAALRTLIVVGDAIPHEPKDNPHNLDWRKECDELKRMNVAIYAVQALDSGPHGPSRPFYRTMAEKTNGYHLFLDQFSYVRDMILAVCIRQCGEERLTIYEQELIARPSGMTQSMRRMFDTMLGRKVTLPDASTINYGDSTSSSDLRPCPPSKYQILEVTVGGPIKQFVQSEGLTFKTGKGFYEFTKPELISAKKEIVLMKESTGELFEGAAARAIAGITSANETKKVAPGVGALGDYRVFVQSTSYNRVLVPGTGFLYEAEDYGRT